VKFTNLTITSAALLAFALWGCTSFACRPMTVTVANERETARLETVPGAGELGRRGRERMQSWAWERAADKHVAVYRRMVGSG
jgi:hypothetical protein